MTEPGVTLTDYGLTLLCMVLGTLICKKTEYGPFRAGFAAFFISLTFASAFGGTVHGFFLNPHTLGYRILWPLTLISIGIAAFSIWYIAARMLFEEKRARLVSKITLGIFIIYGIAVLAFIRDYLIAIIHYLPATLALLAAFLKRYHKYHEKEVFSGIMGIILTFVAAGIQQAGIGFHPVYFDHNAFYHVVQAVGLYLIYVCARHLASSGHNLSS
jgi:hypothetical protein